MTEDTKSSAVRCVGSTDGLGGCAHKWERVYYGDKCKLCGLFFADGNAPWDEEVCKHGFPFDGAPCDQCELGL